MDVAEMQPLYQDPWFTFCFTDDRIIPRFHLEGVPARRHVSVFRIDPGTGERLAMLVTATVGEGGWVDLPEPIIVRAGEAFIVVPEPGRLNHSPGKMLPYGFGVIGVLAMVGYLCGLALGGGNQVVLAVGCAVIAGCVVLLGYGPIAFLIGGLGALTEWFHGKRDG
jgi:hypothetical protein